MVRYANLQQLKVSEMSVAEKYSFLTVEDYLKAEESAKVRHEYIDGRVFAMTGANRRHNKIAGNIFAKLHSFLEGTRCTPFVHDMKVRVKVANCFYYPDVMVACDVAADDSVYTEEPVLIVEVLSASTATIDRREKLTNYLKIPTVREYLIVHQKRMQIECHRKCTDGSWIRTEYKHGDTIIFESLPGQLTVSVDAIYRNVFNEDEIPEVREVEGDYDLSEDEALALDW